MDIFKASYFTVVEMSELSTLLEKMRIDNKSINEIVNLQDAHGISLLQHALIGRQFKIVDFLMENGAHVNIITKMGYNELHLIASNINTHGTVKIAQRLVNMGVDLDLQDQKYQNTAFLCLLLEILKQRTDEGMDFILNCLRKKPDILAVNRAGISATIVIQERGNDEMKKLVKDIMI